MSEIKKKPIKQADGQKPTDKLKDSELRYRRLFESAKNGILILNADSGKIIDVNPFLADLLGFSKKDFIAKDLWEFGFFKDIAESKAAFIELKAKGYIRNDDLQLKTSDGQRKSVEFVSNVFEVDHQEMILCNIRDVTEKKLAQAALGKAEEKYRQLFESISDVFFAMDKDLRYTYWNKACEQLTGIAAKYALGKSLTEVFPDNESTRIAKARYLRAMETKALQHFTVEYPGGRNIIHEVSAYPNEEGVSVFVKDVSEKELMAKALRESESFNSTLLDGSPSPILVTNTDTSIRYVNPAFEKLTGFPAAELLGTKSPYSWWLMEDILNIDNAAVASSIKELIVYEKQYAKKNGELFWVSVGTTPVKIDGEIKYYISNWVDITDRKLSEDARLLSETYLRATLNSTDDGILTIDSQGGVIDSNRRFAELWRVPPELIKLKSDDKLLTHVLDQLIEPDRFLKKVKALYASDQTDNDTLFFKDGRIFERYSEPLIIQNAIVGRVWSFRDITERRQAEQELRETKESLEGFFRLVPDMVCIASTDGYFKKINPAWETTLGYSMAELLSKPFESFILPDDVEPTRHEVARQIGGSSTINFVNRYRTKDGACKWLEWNATPAIGGSVLYAIARDITERKQKETELLQKTTFLEAMVNAWPDGIMVVDSSGKRLFQNQKNIELWDIPLEIAGNVRGAEQQVWVQNLTVDPARFAEKIRYLQLHLLETTHDEVELKNGKILERFANPVVGKDGLYYGRIWSFRDITERRVADNKLRQSEQFNRSLLENSPHPIIVINTDDSIRYVNPAFVNLTGFLPEELIGAKPPFIYWPEDLQELYSTDYRDQNLYSCERLFQKKNGENFWVNLSANAVRDRGEIKYFLVNWVDITERKKAEEQLKYQAMLVETVSDAIISTDLDSHIISWNKASEAIFGWTRKEVVGKRIRDVTKIEFESGSIEELLKQLNEVGYFRGETTQIRRDGTMLYMASSVSQIKDHSGKPIGNVVVHRDITENKKYEKALQESEEKFRSAFMTSLDAFFISTFEEGLFVEANSNFETLFGYTREEMIGKTALELGLYYDPADRARMTSELDTKSYVKDMELKGRKKGGEIIFVSLSTGLILINNKRHILGAIRDITERKRTEEENQRLREKAEMTSRLAAVGEMAAGIAHEINNPLTGILGFSQLLAETPDLPEDIRDAVKTIAEGSKRVKEIVSRILTFARQTKPVKIKSSINELIDATLDLRGYVLRTANIEVVKQLDFDLPWISVDPAQMQQVFLNIIVNAEYSMKKAHGKGTLTISTASSNGQVLISIRDDGLGMDKAVQEKLFHPFFTNKAVGEGTGLGLSLSRSIILEHGGTIEVESAPGRGAKFIISLPETPNSEESPGEDLSSATAQKVEFKSAQILVVDDEVSIRNLIKKILTQQGHEIDTTGDYEEALDHLKSTNYDAVIMDIRMPGMSGIELYALVKERYPGLATKFIFITGDASDLSTRDFLEQTKLTHITKPFDKETLIRKLNGIL